MEASIQQQEETLTLKKLQSHLIKTIVGALAVALLTAMGASYLLIYQTKDSVEELNQNKIETKEDIKQLKDNFESLKNDISDIKISVSNSGIYTTDNKEKVKSLEEDVRDIKKNQEEILKLIYEMKARQR